MSQFERITFIDKSVRSASGMTIAAVSDRFAVSERQVKRDIEYMRSRLNAPLAFDRGRKAYFYGSPFNELEFADEHLLVFYSLVRSLVQNEHYIPLFSEDTLAGIASHISRDYLPVSDRINYQLPVSEKIDIGYFTLVCQAILTRKRVDIAYESSTGEKTDCRVEAERLVNYTGRWYLVAFDLLRKDFRVFHLSCIESLSISAKSCTGTGTASRDRALARYMESGFGIFKGNDVQRAVIRFRGQVAKIVARQLWHKDQHVFAGQEPDGTAWTEMTVPVADWSELLGRILSFGAAAEPLEPAALKAAWKKSVAEMSALIPK